MEKSYSGMSNPQESKILVPSSSHEEEDHVDVMRVADVVEQPMKWTKFKFTCVHREPAADGNLDLVSVGKHVQKQLKALDSSTDMKGKRKRVSKEQVESGEGVAGEGVPTGEYLESLTNKSGSSTDNSSSLSSRDHLKKSRGKKTGADGYYFECMVCDMGGDLLCCDLCPCVYHLECLSPPLKRTPPGKWACPVCCDTPGAVKVVGIQARESKPRFKTTNEMQSAAFVPAAKMGPGPKKGWKLFHRDKHFPRDLDMGKPWKRKREEDMERPSRKRLNLKMSRPSLSKAQLGCGQCFAGINSSGESPRNVFCKECLDLVKQRSRSPSERMLIPGKDTVPTRHSKLKPGSCDICGETGFVIFCDVCPRGYHKDCLNPPRKRAPKGAWCCPNCGPLKEGKEGKDSRSGQARDFTKDVKAATMVKTAVKVVKVVRDAQHSMGNKQEQAMITPAPLEVDQILGCRISLVTHLMSNKIGPGDCRSAKGDNGHTSGEDLVHESKERCCTPRAKFEGLRAIKIRSKSTAEQRADDQVGHVKFVPEEETSAPAMKFPKVAGSPSSSDLRCRYTGSIDIGGDRLVADQSSTAKAVVLDFEPGVSNKSPLKLDDSPRVKATQAGSKLAEGGNSYSDDQLSKITKEGMDVSGISASEEKHGDHVAPDSATAEPGLEMEDVSQNDMRDSSIGLKMQSLAFSGTIKGDLGFRQLPELICNVKDVAILETSQLSANDMCCGETREDLHLSPLDKAGEALQDLPFAPLVSAVPQPDLEFLVKWAGRAHIHNEWVNEKILRRIAKRKLENFKLKHGSVPKMLMEKQWTQPQRIVAKRTMHDKGDEVFVKWCGLSYEECTWEHVDQPVILSSSGLMRRFDHVEQEALKSDADLLGKAIDNLDPILRGHRPTKIKTIKEQPPYLQGGSLFPHQMEALNWLRRCWQWQRNVILADEMGLGKTISACSFIASLRHEFKVRTPCLVLVPLSTIPNWLAEFALWAPSLNVIEYHGSSKARATIREFEWYGGALDGTSKKAKNSFKFNVMLTTYEMVIADFNHLRTVPWEVLVVDEGHRLRNSASKLFNLLNTFSFSHRVLLMATPLQNNFGEMFSLLNFLQPDTFRSLAAFQDKFGSLSTAEHVEELKNLVAPNMLRRLKKDAMPNIPPKTELVVPLDMTSVQMEYYKALLTRNYQVLRNGRKHQSMLNIVMQLRKVCNHPYLITGTEPDMGTPEFLQQLRIKASAKLMLLHCMLGKLKADGHRVLIFSQMTKLLDILEDYLTFEFGQDTFERVDGSVSVSNRQAAIARFNQDTSRFVFLLSTGACGLGINLATADTVIIYDSDFNPHADIQAMNRAHRIGQSKTLLVYRLVVRASVEERILQLAKKKLMLDHLFRNKSGCQKYMDDILRWGTEELFQNNLTQTNYPGSVPDVPCGVDDGDTQQKKKGGELGNKYGGYYFQLSCSKVVWDDVAVKRLLDRSDLSGSHPEVLNGEPGSDVLGSMKAWDWNEQEVIPDEQDRDEATGKEIDMEEVPKAPVLEVENQWDKLLRSRWETLQTEDEASLQRGKRNCKAVSYMESNGQKLKEPSSESSDAEEEDDSEPEYTPVGVALKQKLAKLRARQKYRILQRCSGATKIVDNQNVSTRMLGCSSVPSVTVGAWKKKNDVLQETGLAPWSLPHLLPSERVSADFFPQIDLKESFATPASSIGFISASPFSEPPFHRRSFNPLDKVDRHINSKSSSLHQLLPVHGLSTPGAENVVCLNSLDTFVNCHGTMWLGGVGPVTASSCVMSQIFGRSVIAGDGSRAETVTRLPFSAVSQGLDSGQSVSQVKPALQESLQEVQNKNRLDQSLMQGDLEELSAGAEVPFYSSSHSFLPDSGISLFSSLTPKNGSIRAFNLEDIKSFKGQHYPCESPDVALEFSQKRFGVEENASTGAMEGKQEIPLASSLLSAVGKCSLKCQNADFLATSQPSIQSPRFPNLSIALGLQLIDTSRSGDARAFLDIRTSLPAASSTGLTSEHFRKGLATREVGGSCFSGSQCHKLVIKDMMSIKLNCNEAENVVSTQGFSSPVAADNIGRVCESRDHSTRDWADDELDALWAGVRRHGRGNWVAMLLDSRLCLLKSRSVVELAERWKEEEIKAFGNSEQPIVGRKLPSLQVGGLLEQGLQNSSGAEQGRATCSECTVHPVDKCFRVTPYPEKEEAGSWLLPDMEAKPDTDRIAYFSTSVAGDLSMLSGVQLGDKVEDLGRLEANGRRLNYHNLLDLQSGRSSTSIPTSLPGRRSTSGSVQGTNLVSFCPSGEGVGRLDSSILRMGALDGELSLGLSPVVGVGLAPQLRRHNARDQTAWQQEAAPPSEENNARLQSSFSDRSSIFRFQELHANVQIPQAPSPTMGLPLGNSAVGRGWASLPYNGGPISMAEHKRRARADSGTKAPSAMNAHDTAPSSLPHWLREAVKARSAPPQPPLPSSIAAVVLATNLLYKNSKRLLPPLIHPGYAMAPPNELWRKGERRQHRVKVSQQSHVSRDYSLLTGNPTGHTHLSHLIKVESLTQPLCPLPPIEGPGCVTSRSIQGVGKVKPLLQSKGCRFLPLSSGLDLSQQQEITHLHADSLSHLLSRKSSVDLGFLSECSNPSQINSFNRSNFTLDESNTVPAFLGQGCERPPLDLRAELDLAWKRSEIQQARSFPHLTSLPLQHLFSSGSQGVDFLESFPVGRVGDARCADPDKLQLQQWLLSSETATRKDVGTEKEGQKIDANQNDDNESTSSQTVSDPGIRCKCGKDDDNGHDASSEETISDDGTQ